MIPWYRMFWFKRDVLITIEGRDTDAKNAINGFNFDLNYHLYVIILHHNTALILYLNI